MSPVNCIVPIKIRVEGNSEGLDLDALGDSIAATVQSRLQFANRQLQQRIQSIPPSVFHPPQINIPESVSNDRQAELRDAITQAIARGIQGGLSPGTAGTSGIVLAQYRTPGSPTAARQQRRSAPWVVRYQHRFHIQLQRFIEYRASLRSSTGTQENQAVLALYPDRLNEVFPATAWLVVAQQPLRVDDLVTAIAERVKNLPETEGLFIVWSWAILEQYRAELLLREERHELGGLPTLSDNRGGVLPDGRFFLNTGGKLLFTFLTLPAVTIETTLWLANDIAVQVRVRDLGKIVNAHSFENIFRVPWSSYVEVFGDSPATLHILPFRTIRRVPAETVRYLIRDEISKETDSSQAFFGYMDLLNQETVTALPQAARNVVLEHVPTDQLSPISSDRVEGLWESGWLGAYIYAVFDISEDDCNQALYEPEARAVADQIIAMLQQDRSYPWAWNLLGLLFRHYRAIRLQDRTALNTAFEYMLIALGRRATGRWFREFFDAVESSGNGELHYFVVKMSLSTIFASDPRIQQTIRLLNSRRRSYMRNSYDAQAKVILIDKDPDRPLRVGQRIGSMTRTEKRIKEDRLKELQAAVQEEGQARIGRVLHGEDTRTYTEEEFAKEVLAVAAKKINLSDDDLEKITIERTIHFIDLELRIEDGAGRYYVTYDYYERIDDGAWEPVQGSQHTRSDSDFEFLLWSWEFAKEAAFWEAVSIGISVIAVIAIAWEVGAIAALVEIAGGTANVLVSIGISELIYLATAKHYSLEGFLRAALDGYLFALGFRFAGGLGQLVAGRIGTQSVERIVLGWISERFVVGTVGGASSALLITFSNDVLNILLGRQEGLSSLGDYVRHMALGAALGVVFEFGAGALQPLLRAVGRTGVETLSNIVKQIRAEGINVTQWIELTGEALGNLENRLKTFLNDARMKGLRDAFAERVNEATQAMRERLQTALFRRVLEVADVQITGEVSRGLDKLLEGIEGHVTHEDLLHLVNRLRGQPAQMQHFLEAINALDDAAIRNLAERGQIASFMNATRLHGLILELGGESGWNFLSRVFHGSPVEAEGFLGRLARHGQETGNRVITILLRPGQRVTPEALLFSLDRLGSVSNNTLSALDRLFAAADRETAEAFLRNVSAERLPGMLRFLAALNRGFLEVARSPLSANALDGLDKLLTLAASQLDETALTTLVNGLHGQPGRLQRFLEAIHVMEDGAVTRLADSGQLEELGNSPNLLDLIHRSSDRAVSLLDGPFAHSVANTEAFLGRLAASSAAQQDRAIEILLRPGQAVTPEGVLQATAKLGNISDDLLGALDRLYSVSPSATVDDFLRQVNAASLQELLTFLQGLGNAIVRDLSDNGYLLPLSNSPRVLAYARAGRNLGLLFRLTRARGGDPARLISALEHFTDLPAAVRSALALVGDLERVEVAAQVDRPGYPGSSAQAVADADRLIQDDVNANVAREALEFPAGHNVTAVNIAGPGRLGPDVRLDLDDGTVVGREATHTESGGTTAADLEETIRNRVQEKIDDFRVRAGAYHFSSREIYIQVRPGAAGVNFDPLLNEPFFNGVIARLTDLASVDRILFYNSQGVRLFVYVRP
jgi:hypothetical protein